MRQEGKKFITLEEDIQRIWKAHGMTVVKESVSSSHIFNRGCSRWVIIAKPDPLPIHYVVCECGNLVACEKRHDYSVLPCPSCRTKKSRSGRHPASTGTTRPARTAASR